MDRRRKEVRVRDYDYDAQGTGARQHRERRQDEGDSDNVHVEVSRALEGGRPDALGAQGLLHLQRAAGNAGAAALMRKEDDDASPVTEVVGSPGEPLDRATKADMEGRFGADFSDVEVHTDGQAADSARSVSAQAYTVGNHVVFGEGKYQPGTSEGRHMIAHELTHVVQQRSGPVDGTSVGGGVKVSDPSDRFEREADRTASDVLSRTSEASVQREEAPIEEEEEGAEAPLQSMEVQREAAPEEEEAEEQPASEGPASEAPAEEIEEEQA